MADKIRVAINVRDGVAVRGEVRYKGGTALPGKVYVVDSSDYAISQGLVQGIFVKLADDEEAPQEGKPKAARKPRSSAKGAHDFLS